jgi:emp24/gp25L/p24 family/GOLD
MLLSLLISLVHSTTVTISLGAHERSCYYANSKVIGEKVAFYFAVQSGGNFDVDYDILDPNNQVVIHGNAESGVNSANLSETMRSPH